MERKSFLDSMEVLEEDPERDSEDESSRRGSTVGPIMEQKNRNRSGRRSSVPALSMVGLSLGRDGRMGSRRSSVANSMEKWGSQGDLLSRSPSPTQFPRLPLSRKTSGIWSRRASLVGEEYLKKDDEMIKMIRSGRTIELPRTINHHMPTIPIYNSEEFVEKLVVKTYDIDSDEFQIYKTAQDFLYETPNNEAEVTRVGQRRRIFHWRFKRETNGKDLTLEEMYDIMKELLGTWSQSEMDEMLKTGYTPQEILNHFMNYGKTQDQENREFHKKIHQLIDGKNMSPEQILELLRKELGIEERKQLEEMLARGDNIQQVVDYFMNLGKSTNLLDMMKKLRHSNYMSDDLKFKFLKDNLSAECQQEMKEMLADGFSMQEILEYFSEHGKTQAEENKNLADKMKNLINGKNLSETEILNLLEKELGTAGKKKMEEMLNQGFSMQEIINQFLNPKEDDEGSFNMLINKLSNGKNLNEEEMFQLLKDQLGAESQKQMQKMLEQGFTQKEVLEYFMQHGKTQKDEDLELVKIMEELLQDENLSPSEIVAIMTKDLNDDDKRRMEEMLQSGCTIEEIMNHFKNREDEREEEHMTEIQKKIHRLRKNENLTNEEIYEALYGMLGAGNKKRMETMLAQGISMREIIEHFTSAGKTQEEEDKELADKIRKLTDNKDMTEADFVELLRKELTGEQLAEMEQMLKDGFTLQDIIGKIVYHDSEFTKRMKKLLAGKTLSQNEMYNLISEQLGPQSKKEMEAMLAQGIPLEDIINHFMSHGKSQEEESTELSNKLKNMIRGKSMSKEEILELLSNELGNEQKLQMEEMLKKGMSIKDIIDSFILPQENYKPNNKFSLILNQMTNGKKLNDDEMFKLIREQLGIESREIMDKGKKDGSLLTEILDILVRSGKESQAALEEKLQTAIDYLNIKENLDPIAKSAMDDLLKQGCSIDEVIRLFEKYGNNLDGLCNDIIFKKHILVLTLPHSLFVIKRIKLRPPLRINNTVINDS